MDIYLSFKINPYSLVHTKSWLLIISYSGNIDYARVKLKLNKLTVYKHKGIEINCFGFNMILFLT